MRSLVAVVLMVGCASVPAAPSAPTPAVPAATRANRWFSAVRSPQHLEAIPGRAWLATIDEASLDRRTWTRREARALDLACARAPAPVIARGGDDVQIVHAGEDILLAVWVKADDLAPVARRTTALWSAPPAAGDAPHGRLHLGARVRVIDRRDDHARVELRRGAEYAQGWVASDDLDVVSRVAPPPPREPGPRPWTRSPLVAAPAPDAVVLGGNGFVAPVEVVGGAGDWTQVRYRGESIDLDGWIEAAALRREPVAFDDHSGCSSDAAVIRTVPIQPTYFGPEARRHRWLTVPRGTCLWVSPGGPVVAVATEDTARDFRRADRGGWWTTSLSTPWGDLDVGIPMDRDEPIVPARTCDDAPRRPGS